MKLYHPPNQNWIYPFYKSKPCFSHQSTNEDYRGSSDNLWCFFNKLISMNKCRVINSFQVWMKITWPRAPSTRSAFFRTPKCDNSYQQLATCSLSCIDLGQRWNQSEMTSGGLKKFFDLRENFRTLGKADETCAGHSITSGDSQDRWERLVWLPADQRDSSDSPGQTNKICAITFSVYFDRAAREDSYTNFQLLAHETSFVQIFIHDKVTNTSQACARLPWLGHDYRLHNAS